ncbi:MAG: hypothetical protein LBH80_03760 [Prevotellaceae bacterium]|jgi:hypothetical protein|nr:hypothetical protein [Prevotellaceae bacterium]
MKKRIIYCTLLLSLLLSVTPTGAGHNNLVDEPTNNIGTPPTAYQDDTSHHRTSDNQLCFTTPDNPFSAQHIQQLRTNYHPHPVVSRPSQNFFHLRIIHSTLLAQASFSVAKLAYAAHYSHIQQRGYYIYQLHKLLI